MFKRKLKEWFKRYAFAEIISLVFVIAFSNLSMFFSGNIILSGFVGTWLSNLGFYGTITFTDLQHKRRKNNQLRIKDFFIQLRNMLIEFGAAEYLDSFLVRPFFLSFFPYIISNYSLAIFMGTIVANITYYIPTIMSYELRKKMLKD